MSLLPPLASPLLVQLPSAGPSGVCWPVSHPAVFLPAVAQLSRQRRLQLLRALPAIGVPCDGLAGAAARRDATLPARSAAGRPHHGGVRSAHLRRSAHAVPGRVSGSARCRGCRHGRHADSRTYPHHQPVPPPGEQRHERDGGHDRRRPLPGPGARRWLIHCGWLRCAFLHARSPDARHRRRQPLRHADHEGRRRREDGRGAAAAAPAEATAAWCVWCSPLRTTGSSSPCCW